MPRLEPILAKLDRAQHNLLRAADAIPADHWKTCPRQGAWCAAELIAHIITIERTVVAAALRILKKQPKRTPVWKRFRLPFMFAEMRLIRLKTPIPTDSQLVREKDAMLSELKGTRERTLALIQRAYRNPYPVCKNRTNFTVA